MSMSENTSSNVFDDKESERLESVLRMILAELRSTQDSSDSPENQQTVKRSRIQRIKDTINRESF